jgi:hypothetical protein
MSNVSKQSPEHQILAIIEHEREKRGTIQNVADLLGVRKQTVFSWLTLKSKPDTDKLLIIASETKSAEARAFALKCLHLRYPKFFSNGH